jgi:hypothetical protein
VSRELVIGIACGVIVGAWLSLATSPRTAIAQSSAGTPGLYQIQIASGMARQVHRRFGVRTPRRARWIFARSLT